MTAPVDRAKLGRANRRKGADAERAVAKWLRANGFPGAERAVRSGWVGQTREIADPGDITGTPGLVWQVKDCQREQIATWLDDTDQQRAQAHNAAYGLLVVRRRGRADPGQWWCWLPMAALVDLLDPGDTRIMRETGEHPVRLELHTAVHLLRAGGWGDDDTAVSW